MTTTERLLHLLSLMQSRREWPGSLLAARLNVNDRTVRRDIERLRQMGYKIQASMGPEGGYRLDAGNALPPLLFDDDQAVAVAIALRTATNIGAGIEEAALRALGTIRQVMPTALRHRVDALEVAIVHHAGDAAPTPASFDLLVTLAHTIRDHQTLVFEYAPRDATDNGEPYQRRRVEPHHLVTTHGRWYLVAWDLDREDWRLFRVDRILPRIFEGAQFLPRTVPGGDVREFVSARFKGSDVNAWTCQGIVRLHMPAREALPFAGDAKVTAIDEHTCTIESGSWSWRSLSTFFGRFDVEMEVVSPPELAAAFSTLAHRYAHIARSGSISAVVDTDQ